MIKSLVSTALVCCLMIGAEPVYHARFNTAHAEEDWKAEFDDICGKTIDAMTLSKAELKGLVERCEKLRPRIEKLDESAAKVYLRRLQMCKDLFVYVLDSPPR
jgi:hypothetical protein